MAGPAVPKEAWQTGTGVGGAACVDTLGPLGYVTVVQACHAVIDGALVHNSFKHKVDTMFEESPLSRPRALPSSPHTSGLVHWGDGAGTPDL